MIKEFLKPRVSILTLVDPREEIYETAPKWGFQYDEINRKEHSKLVDKLSAELDIVDVEIVNSKEDSIASTKKFISKGAELLIVFIPGWTYPVFCAVASRTALFSSVPTLLVSSFALSGPSAAKGALDEIGAIYEVVYGSLDQEQTINKIISYAKAASTVTRLRGMTHGLIGGRSMGMFTTIVDPSYWLKAFGIDIEHVDQSEILRIGKEISDKEIDDLYRWLKKNFKKIDYDGKMLTPEILRNQIRGYLAIRKIVDSNRFDFVGVKCINELSDYFCSQCLSAGLMNDPYDNNGTKKPIIYACECDSNGALSMEILHLLSGGKPILFMDLISFNEEEKVITCMNCGGASTWYSMRSEKVEENLNKVEILPHIHGKAGGGCLAYTARSSEVVTLMRLSRVNGNYKMFVISGKLVENVRRDINLPWPTANVKVEFNPKTLLEEYDSQHVHIVDGDLIEECKYVAKIFGMDIKIFK